LLTPRRVRELLAAHGLAPSRRHGQNFVVDPNTVRKVVRDAGVRAGDLVVEIGPGLGSLTLALREAGAEVVAIEIDRGLVSALTGVVDEGVRIIHADAMDVDYAELLDRPARLVANLPYNVATPLLITTLETGRFSSAHVMVQREVGERWCAGPGSPRFGAVSVKVAALGEAAIVAPVSRAAFWPVPRVDSVTVAVRPYALDGDAGAAAARRRLFALVDAGFAQRRKRLRNSLSAGGWPPGDVERALIAIGRDDRARAEELGLDDWRRLQTLLAGGVRPSP
jgi:16S rRNA (adenine1518-N6/adenine1519-N6)-dimethyltransferase